MSKSSRISLYSSDNLEEKGCFLEALDAKFQVQSPNVFEWHAPSFALAGQTTSANDVPDLGQKIADMVALQASDSATQAAGIATNVASISAEVVQRTADVAALSSTIGSETSARSGADTTLQANIDAEQAARIAADAVVQAAVDTEAATRATAVSVEETARVAADVGIQSQIDALGVIDASTLASINAMLAAYQAADSTIQGLISALDTRLTSAEATLDTLTE